MLDHLEARAIAGVEIIEGDVYRRTVGLKGCTGIVEVKHLPQWQSLGVTIKFPDVQCLPEIVTRVLRLFDLGADIDTIDAHLAQDPLLTPLVAKTSGTSRAWRLGRVLN